MAPKKTPDATDAAAGDEAGDATEGKYYCPGCGKRSDAKGTCTGTAEAPHQPIELVSTKELDGDPEKHTPAPPSE